MDKHRERITPWQLTFIVISSILGVSMLAFPRFVVKGAGLGAPLASLFGVSVAFVGLVSIVLLGRRFPKHTLVKYNEIILGKAVGRIFTGVIILFFVLIMGLETRQFSEVIAGGILPSTPIHIAIFMMIFLCATTSFQNVSTFAYIHFFYMPLIIFPLLLVILPIYRDIEVYHLTPIIGNNLVWKEFIQGGLVVTQAMLSFFIITMVIPYMKEPKKCVKSGIVGFIIASLFVMFIVIIVVGVFGEEEVHQMIWPTLILGRMISVPGDILARVDAILIISWIYGVFTTQLSYYFLIVRGIGELFRYYNYRVIALLGTPVVFVIALLPRNIYEMYDYILFATFFGLPLTIIYPVFLLVIAKLRKKGEVSA